MPSPLHGNYDHVFYTLTVLKCVIAAAMLTICVLLQKFQAVQFFSTTFSLETFCFSEIVTLFSREIYYNF